MGAQKCSQRPRCHDRREQGRPGLPYLPAPEKLVLLERGQAGFNTLNPELRPEEIASQERGFRSYGAWWEAQRRLAPARAASPVRHVARPTTYWPYGSGVTMLKGTLEES